TAAFRATPAERAAATIGTTATGRTAEGLVATRLAIKRTAATRLAAERLAVATWTPTCRRTALPRPIVAARAAIVIKRALRAIPARTIGRTTGEITACGTITAIAGWTPLEAALRTITEIAAGWTVTETAAS